jgi:hypothetical protein
MQIRGVDIQIADDMICGQVSESGCQRCFAGSALTTDDKDFNH